MPALKNKRRELFCQARANGLTQLQAAINAGFSEKAAEKQGSRINKEPIVQNRIAELRRKIVEPTQQPIVFMRQAVADKQYRLTILQEFVTILRASCIDDDGKPRTHVMREARECLKHAAIEVGDWEDKQAHRLVEPKEDFSNRTPEELFAEQIILNEAIAKIEALRDGHKPLEIAGSVSEVVEGNVTPGIIDGD